MYKYNNNILKKLKLPGSFTARLKFRICLYTNGLPCQNIKLAHQRFCIAFRINVSAYFGFMLFSTIARFEAKLKNRPRFSGTVAEIKLEFRNMFVSDFVPDFEFLL